MRLKQSGAVLVTKKATHWLLTDRAFIADSIRQQLAFEVEIAGRALTSFRTDPLDGPLPAERFSGVSNLGLRSREGAQFLHNG